MGQMVRGTCKDGAEEPLGSWVAGYRYLRAQQGAHTTKQRRAALLLLLQVILRWRSKEPSSLEVSYHNNELCAIYYTFNCMTILSDTTCRTVITASERYPNIMAHVAPNYITPDLHQMIHVAEVTPGSSKIRPFRRKCKRCRNYTSLCVTQPHFCALPHRSTGWQTALGCLGIFEIHKQI